MCQICGQPANYSCGCNRTNYPRPFSCVNPGPCPIQLDAQCVIYHKQNNTLSGLVNLGLGNGATLELILDTIDTYIGQIKPATWALPCLRAIPFTINTLQNFAEAVDVTLCNLQDQITTLADEAATPLVVADSPSFHFAVSGTLDHHLTGNVKVSANAGNQLSVLSDGLVVPPQTLIPDYTDKSLAISDGNSIDMTGFFCDTVVWLGNVTADPGVVSDGQYWYRTDTNSLRIKLNGTIKTIAIS